MTYTDSDPRRMIARLAVAVLVADGRITNDELDALECLDGLGLGPISDRAEGEIQRARREVIDVAAACAPLAGASAQAVETIMATLTELAASDGRISAAEVQVLERVAECLLFKPEQLVRLLEAVTAHPGVHIEHSIQPLRREPTAPPPTTGSSAPAPPREPRLSTESAFKMLGLAPGSSRAQIDAAYLELVDRYQPGHVLNLGPEFVVLAVRKLGKATIAYEAALASLRT